MILPTKHLSADKALISVGARILKTLENPQTVSSIWNKLQLENSEDGISNSITYSWFVLALDLLYILGAINYEAGRVSKVTK